MKKFVLLLSLVCSYGCNQFYFAPYLKSSHRPDAPSASGKYFFQVNNIIDFEEVPESLLLEKVYLQSLKLVDGNDERYYLGDFINRPVNNQVLQQYDNSLRSSLKKYVETKLDSEIIWTNKNIPLNYAFMSFDPFEIKHKDLLNFYGLDIESTVLLPMICTFHDDDKISGQSFIDSYKLVIAFFIFDKSQIYYAKSVGVSKSNFIQNSINPKDNQFLQSEWDYLVYEALRPLLEKGVELEIRSPLAPDTSIILSTRGGID